MAKSTLHSIKIKDDDWTRAKALGENSCPEIKRQALISSFITEGLDRMEKKQNGV